MRRLIPRILPGLSTVDSGSTHIALPPDRSPDRRARVQAQESAEDGQMVVALVDGESATVKKLFWHSSSNRGTSTPNSTPPSRTCTHVTLCAIVGRHTY